MPGVRVGQIVEADASGYPPGVVNPIQTGDRGTIVAEGRVTEFGSLEAKVLWHKNGRESWWVEDRLRLYTDPIDAPGRSKGAFATMQALRVVIREEHPHAMEEVLRDLERARMISEDLRGVAFSQYGTNYTLGVRVRDDPKLAVSNVARVCHRTQRDVR